MQLFRTDQKLTSSWDLVKPSFKLLQENIWPVFYLSFLPALILAIASVFLSNTHGIPNNRIWVGLVLLVIAGIWSILASPGLLLLQVKAAQGEHPSAMQCFRQGLKYIMPLFGMALLAGFLVFLGLLAFIVPGLIILRGIFLAQFYVVDQKLSPIEALKRSYADSKPNAGYIWGTIGVAVVFGFAASLVDRVTFAGIGTILSLCISLVYMFAPALRYSEIAKKPRLSA